MDELVQGDGWSVASVDSLGDNYGFRKIRQPMGVTAFGANIIVVPPGYGGPNHTHEEQEELYFVHSGTARFEFDGAEHEVGPGGVVFAAPSAPRRFHNVGDDDLVLFIVGGKDGYVGRDGVVADGETSRVRGPDSA